MVDESPLYRHVRETIDNVLVKGHIFRVHTVRETIANDITDDLFQKGIIREDDDEQLLIEPQASGTQRVSADITNAHFRKLCDIRDTSGVTFSQVIWEALEERLTDSSRESEIDLIVNVITDFSRKEYSHIREDEIMTTLLAVLISRKLHQKSR